MDGGVGKVDVGQGCGFRVPVRSSALWQVRGIGKRVPWPQVREGQEAGRKAQGFRQAEEAWGGWG